MPAALVVVFAGCLGGHLLLANMVPSPWWVPDLTLVGLVLAGARAPRSWLLLSAVAALISIGWTVRWVVPVTMGYLAIGGVGSFVGRQWDATDRRIEGLLVAAASVWLTLGALWLEGLWSARLIALAGIHVAVTCVVVPLVHQVMARAVRSV